MIKIIIFNKLIGRGLSCWHKIPHESPTIHTLFIVKYIVLSIIKMSERFYNLSFVYISTSCHDMKRVSHKHAL
jgi:hypothetical protein